jgi:hypothetical protein
MLTARSVILTSVALFALIVGATVYSLLRPPDSGGAAADSYGTRRAGQRGLYETLSELGVPVARRVEPPGRDLPPETTLVLWGPDEMLVSQEPRHLQRLADWVRGGGRIVLAAPQRLNRQLLLLAAEIDGPKFSLWDALGLENVQTQELSDAQLPPPVEGAPPSVAANEDQPDDSPAADDWESIFGETRPENLPRSVVGVRGTGRLADAAAHAAELSIPGRDLRVIRTDERKPEGAVTFEDTSGAMRTLIGAYRLGAGEAIVVGDPMLFNNFALAHSDNSVLAVQLLAAGGRTVMFDEFYHGLSVRGNPFWLLTKPGYALLTIAVLGLIAIRTWRAGVLLGPPLTTPERSRRTIGEYVDAMSRFFQRGHRTRCFLLEAVYTGALRQLAREHGLEHAKLDLERIAQSVARRDPRRARQLRTAAEAVDAVLAKQDKGSEPESVRAMQKIVSVL